MKRFIRLKVCVLKFNWVLIFLVEIRKAIFNYLYTISSDIYLYSYESSDYTNILKKSFDKCIEKNQKTFFVNLWTDFFQLSEKILMTEVEPKILLQHVNCQHFTYLAILAENRRNLFRQVCKFPKKGQGGIICTL